MGVLFSKCDDDERIRKSLNPKVDVFREYPLRILGYAGHLGICSNLLPPPLVTTGKMITTAYILGDVFSKASYSSRKLEPEGTVVNKAIDAFVWQLLASVLIPGFILSRTRYFTRSLIRKTSSNTCGPNSQTMKWLPCILGLLLTPFIIKPIDNCVDYIMGINNPTEDIKKSVEKTAKKAVQTASDKPKEKEPLICPPKEKSAPNVKNCQ